MCGRFDLHSSAQTVAEHFAALSRLPPELLRPRYNVAPSQAVPVVRDGAGGRELVSLAWGLLPSWAKAPDGLRPINARVETVFDKPMFRAAVRRRRCLVPADAYYEWQVLASGKQPWRIAAADGGLLALAGIWEQWSGGDGPPLQSMALLVRPATAGVAAIHDRMPVLLAPADHAAWLAPESPPEWLRALVGRTEPGVALAGYPVGLRVNNARNDGPELIEPAGPLRLL